MVPEDLVHGVLGPANGKWRVPGELPGDLHRLWHYLVLWHGVVHEADAFGLLPVDPFAGEQIFLCPCHADKPGPDHDAAVAGHEPHAAVRVGPARALGP